MTELHFSQNPGRWERHLLQKKDNPLFPEPEQTISRESLEEAQRLDHEELTVFITQFRKLILEAVELQPNAESGQVLGIKERLDKSYEQSAGLADDQQETREAILKLQETIMAAVRKGAGADSSALRELAQEEQARAVHFQLLEHPLVADLLAPDSPVGAEELAPTLLTAPKEEFEAALTLFDDDQLVLLRRDAEALLKGFAEIPEEIRQRVSAINPG